MRATPKPASKSAKDQTGKGPQDFQSTPLASRVESFDLEVVRSAREAGVPDSQIARMLDIAAKGKPQLGDVPPPRRKVSILSDSEEGEDEDAEEEEQAAAADGSNKVLVSAVSKLTKIAAQLASRRKKDRSLEGVLDGVGSGATDSSGLAGSRRRAAALRALRAALVKQPEELYKVLEANLERDFNVVNQVPGSASVQVTSRAWLEMRSHVQNFQTPARLLWGIAGALDCMRQHKHAEARARLGLMLAAGDQLSIDRGNWLIAAEMMLEDGPPLATFGQHQLPQEHEAPYTSLVDGRWVDLFVAKLKDYEELAEKKRKLTFKKLPVPPIADPAAKANLKGKGKGKGKGGGGNPGSDDSPASRSGCGQPCSGCAVASALTSPMPPKVVFESVMPVAATPSLRSSTSARVPRDTANCGWGVSSPLQMGSKIKRDGCKERLPPGSNASTVRATTLWNSMLRWMLRSKAGKLSSFLNSFLAGASKGNKPCTLRSVWPLPIPFWIDASTEGDDAEVAVKRAINVMVLVLNWLHLKSQLTSLRTLMLLPR